jgi:sigma-B regulation protein RsbU (phosphoserine phosphatase)
MATPSAEVLSWLDSAACGLLRTDAHGVITFANRTFCRWLGYARDELIGQQRFERLLTAGGRIFHQTHWMPLLQMQGSISEVKLDLLHVDGSTIPMVINAIRRSDNGATTHDIAVYVARDRDKYERELLLSRKKLQALVEEANRLHADAADRATFAEQMVGIVSHDLKNPLSAIAMGTELLSRAELSPAQRSVLSRIGNSTQRATRLISDLLDFTQARLGTGISVTLLEIDIHEAVEQAVEELSLAHVGRQLSHQRFGEGRCRADGNRLAQLVSNLGSNAMAYGDARRPVTVISRVEQTSFSIAVHNFGTPIPSEELPQLFQPMTRGTSMSGSGRSVGLGLYIVSQIARAHGGQTVVTSSEEAGTTFLAVIPR